MFASTFENFSFMQNVTTYPKLVALLAGAALPLAFAPVGLFPLGFLAPVVLHLLWEGASPRQAFGYGYLFGVACFGVGVSWIFISIHDMGHLPLELAGFITALFIAFLALFPALQGYLTARFLSGYSPIHAVFAFPALWVAFEILRGWVMTGFPWLYLGYSQMDTPLRGLAPVLGVLGISFATAATGGLLLVLVRSKSWPARLGWALPLLILWGGAAALATIEWTVPNGESLQVSLLQVAIPQQVRWQPEQRAANIRRYLELTRQHWGARLIIWPENALTIFYHDAVEFLEGIANEAQEHGADLLIGLPVMDPNIHYNGESAPRRYYNALVGLPTGQFYLKHHLVPFTEFLPLKSLLGPVVSFFQVPMSDFSHGPEAQKPLLLAGHRLGISICYESAFSREIAAALPSAEILVNVSNDGWFGNSLAPYQNLQMAQMRALEMGRWLLRDTNTGISAIIGPNGRLAASSPLFQDAVLTADVQPTVGATPYVHLGDSPVWALIALGLFAGRTMTRVYWTTSQELPT
ncbi:Apolipoprotein N-acyltransferase [Gammaproteobacteria bacterium]